MACLCATPAGVKERDKPQQANNHLQPARTHINQLHFDDLVPSLDLLNIISKCWFNFFIFCKQFSVLYATRSVVKTQLLRLWFLNFLHPHDTEPQVWPSALSPLKIQVVVLPCQIPFKSNEVIFQLYINNPRNPYKLSYFTPNMLFSFGTVCNLYKILYLDPASALAWFYALSLLFLPIISCFSLC